jgi:hypothetical protein
MGEVQQKIEVGVLVGFEVDQEDFEARCLVSGWQNTYKEPHVVVAMPDPNHVFLEDGRSGKILPLGQPSGLNVGFLKVWQAHLPPMAQV